MSRTLLFALLILGSAAAHASPWVVETTRDSMTDKVQMSATSRNSQEFTLSVYRNNAGRAWVLFALPERSSEMLGSRLPMFRIDSLPPVTLDDRRESWGTDLVDGASRWVKFQAWHGSGQPLHGVLRELMDGQRVVFRYFLAGGGYKETSFDLQGAKAAIAKALGVKAEIDPNDVKIYTERKAQLDAALAKCDKSFPPTTRKNSECRIAAARQFPGL